MTDIVERLTKGTGDGLQAYDWMQEAAVEITALRYGLQLIAEHPVERSEQWQVGAREMQRLALQTINGGDFNLVRRLLEMTTELACAPGTCGCAMRGEDGAGCLHGKARAALEQAQSVTTEEKE